MNAWSGAAPFWEKHREIIRQLFAPGTQALVEDGRIGSRDTVLDIATGPGEPALRVATVRRAADMSEKLREKVAMLSREQLIEMKRESLEAAPGYFKGRAMSFPAQVLIVSGTKAVGHN